MRRACLIAVGVLLLATSPAGAQGQAQKPAAAPAAAGPAAEVLGAWHYVGKKLVDMAEDFPEEKYGYRPTPDVRTFAEHLLHIAGANFLFVAVARGEKPGAEDLSAEKYKTKPEIAAVLKKSFAEVAAAIQQTGDAGMDQRLKHPFADRMISKLGLWMMAVENAGEHYGSLVVYYRLNGIVPPASRRRS